MRSTTTALILLLIISMSGLAASQWDSRLHSTKTGVLIAWLDWEHMPEDMKQDEEVSGAICRELKARREVPVLVTAYTSSTNPAVRCHLVSEVLYWIDDKRVERAFSEHVSEQEDEETYYMLLYLARRGSTNALDILNRHYFHYLVSSWQWSAAVTLFGKHKYKPAITNLVESLDAASLNVSAAACVSLGQIFPDAPKKFRDPDEAKRFYEERIKRSPNPTVQRTGANPSATETQRTSSPAGPARGH